MNTNFTKNPIVGTPLTPSVIKQIHTAARRYMPIAGNRIRTSVTAGGTIISVIPAPAPRKQKDKPLPFEVRYDGTLDSGAGGWKIYLPTEHLLSYGGAYVNTSDISGATPIPDANGDDTAWSTLDDIDTSADHVWLVVTMDAGGVSAEFAAAEGQSVTGSSVLSVCIAEVSYEASEEEGGLPKIEIKQSVVGALCLGGEGGGAITLDDVSTDFNDDSEVQVKDWDTGTPASPTTIAQDIHDGNATAQGTVVERTTGGALRYKQPGTLEQLLGSSVNKSSQKVLTGLRWDTSSHQLVISSANITVANGVITSWTDNNDEDIPTTPISDIV